MTISLLPDFLASRMSGTLEEVEHAVAVVEASRSREAAVEQLRPASAADAVTLPSALRWLRRRVTAVRAVLVAVVTLVPELFECRPTTAAVRGQLGVAQALEAIRSVAAAHLDRLPSPIGFRARARRREAAASPTPHEAGPDPP